MRRRYMKALRAYARRGGKRRKKAASRLRRRMIARNPRSSYAREMQKAMHNRMGRKAEKLRRSFWGTREPAQISTFADGKKKTTWLTGLGNMAVRVGKTTRKGEKTKLLRRRWLGAATPSGRQIYLFVKGKAVPRKQRWRYLGRVHESHYVPSKGIERQRSFKSGKYWVHQHHDENGTPPKAYMDQAGHVKYAPGTYRVKGQWIHR